MEKKCCLDSLIISPIVYMQPTNKDCSLSCRGTLDSTVITVDPAHEAVVVVGSIINELISTENIPQLMHFSNRKVEHRTTRVI